MVRIESKAVNGPYTYVEVKGSQMHLYDSKEGEHTIVMLPGYGTGSPIGDFKPLVKALEEDYRVIVIEPFGYGYSQTTQSERSVENMIEEYRLALDQIGAQPPYILMPHSISGIYSFYYAGTYPDEVMAIIGNDIAVPLIQAYDPELKPKWYRYVVGYMGLPRLAGMVLPKMITPNLMNGSYTEEEKKTIRTLTGKTFMNTTILNEWEHYRDNGSKASKVDLPEAIPLLIFSAHAEGSEPDDFLACQRQLVEEHERGSIVLLDGSHYLHWTHSVEMAGYIKDFLEMNLGE